MTAMPERETFGERAETFTRILRAPRALVFRAWTDPTLLAQWWGPRGFTAPVCEVDARPGGRIRIVMRGPDGWEHAMTGVFREVTPPERLVFTTAVPDEAGRPLLEGLNILTLAESGGLTTLTLEAHAVALVEQARAWLGGMKQGWGQSLDRLVELAAPRSA